MNKYKFNILVCSGTGCKASKSAEIIETFNSKLDIFGLSKDVQVIGTGCFGFCEKGPIVKIMPDNTFYVNVTPINVEEIVAEHLIKGRKVEHLLYKNPITDQYVSDSKHMGFFKKQIRIALRNCGVVNPDKIDDYIAREGFQSLGKCLTEYTSADVIDIIKKSGLRGRGGGGFPTGVKWENTAKSPGDQKYIICNADEGDPGAFMDRSVLEGDPFSIIEGMTIGAYAVGANKGFVYIRAEYPLAIKRLEKAIEISKEYGLLGDNIMDTDFSFDIEIRLGAGAFVCGEETALINSIQGLRGQPRMRPPYPSLSGLWGHPTCINNVETWANIIPIIQYGADWFNKIGTETSKGTKVFALAGKVQNNGLIEVPMGTTLREVVYEIGGGVPNGELKAVQTGGPSGGCIPVSQIDTPIDYENLKNIGSIMGSGGMIVLDQTDCMVQTAKFFLEFTKDESCGKCLPCREGTLRMLEILERITEGKGEKADIDKLERLGKMIKRTSLCGLGQTAPNPVLSMLQNFREEFEVHIIDHSCPTQKCQKLIKYFINKDKCTGCTLCAKRCPILCINGSRKQPHEIIQQDCIKCGECFNVCKFDAVEKH